MRYKFLVVLAFAVLGHNRMSIARLAPEVERNFCNTLSFMSGYADFNFEHVLGKQIGKTAKGIRYASRAQVVGVTSESIVHDSVWRYEGIVYRDISRTKMNEYYKEYASQLTHCYRNGDHKLTEEPNATSSLAIFPNLVYRYKNPALGAIVVLKVTYDAASSNYEMTLCVWKAGRG